MAIDIDDFAQASISVSPTGVGSGNFGILGFFTKSTDASKTDKEISLAERNRKYTSLASVGEDWETSSEVYKAATSYYSQTPTPVDFMVGMVFVADQAAVMQGGGHGTLEDMVAITSGAMTIEIDGGDVVLTSMDFSSAVDFDDCATEIDTNLGANGTCTYSDVTGLFSVVSGTTGASSTIQPATGSEAELFGFAAHQASVADGVVAETIVAGLAANEATGNEFIGLVTHKDYRDVLSGAVGETTEEIADWAEASKKIFCNTTNDLATLQAVSTSDIASVLKNKSGLRYTLSTFSKDVNQYPSASVFGRAASVNFNNIGTTITLNLKQMPTITAEDLTPNQFSVLRSKNCSAIVRIGNSVNAYTDSRMAGGSWFDTTHGLMWLENRVETDMFNLLYVNNTKIPFTQVGINTAEATLERSLEAAVRNGLAAPGYLPDGTFLPKGFITIAVPLEQVPSGDKGNRIYQGLSFKMTGAGAMHEVLINGEFSE